MPEMMYRTKHPQTRRPAAHRTSLYVAVDRHLHSEMSQWADGTIDYMLAQRRRQKATRDSVAISTALENADSE